jgi:hypothetical protein
MKPFSLIVLLTLFSSPAAAVDVSWRDALIGYYRFDVALDTCADVRVSGEDVRLLESAISEAERRSGLSEEAMDELYAMMEYEADLDDDRFCAESVEAITRVRGNSQDAVVQQDAVIQQDAVVQKGSFVPQEALVQQ